MSKATKDKKKQNSTNPKWRKARNKIKRELLR